MGGAEKTALRRGGIGWLKMALPVLALILFGCAAHYETSPVEKTVEETMETLKPLGQGSRQGSLQEHYSDNAVYTAIGDRATTIGLQFPGKISRINLRDVALITLQNNDAVELQQYDQAIAERGIEAARGIYDLMLGASANYRWARRQINAWNGTGGRGWDDLLFNKNQQYGFGLSFQQLVPSGGVFQLYGQYDNVKNYTTVNPNTLTPAVDPYDMLTLGVGFTQPLLKGFGAYVTNAPIELARLGEDVEQENLRLEVTNQLVSAINLYWNLVFAMEEYELRKLTLDQARELLRVTQVKLDAEMVAPSVLLQAQAEVSAREARLIDAVRAVADAQDQLKQAMNISRDSEQWNVNLIPTEQPKYWTLNLNEEGAYQKALKLRPEYRMALRGKDMAQIEMKVAKNATLPQLDATVGYEMTGMGDRTGNAIDSLESRDFNGWNAGLDLSYPLQNRTAQAQLDQKGLTLRKSELQLDNLRELIRLEVRTAIRALDTNRKLIEAYAANVKAEEANLDSQMKRYDVGFGTIYEVLDFQEDLATAQVNYLEAVINFNKAAIQLEKVTGSFLQNNWSEK